MKRGDVVRIKREDPKYGGYDAEVVQVDTRDGKPYLGLHMIRPYTVGHTVWRFEDALVVVQEAKA